MIPTRLPLVAVATFAVAVIVAGTSTPAPPPIPHDELHTMINEVRAEAEVAGLQVTAFGIQCNPPTCPTAHVTIRHPAPEFETAMRERFRGHIVFEHGRGGMPIICMFPNSESEMPETCGD